MSHWTSGEVIALSRRADGIVTRMRLQSIHCRLGVRDRMHPEETVRFRPIWLLGFDSQDSGPFLFRRIRARCTDLTVNQ
jgi:hypothetical protein